MAEESPRLAAGEDSEEEDGEEAAEAPVLENSKKVAPSPKDYKKQAAVAPSPKDYKKEAAVTPEPRQEEKKPPVQASPPSAAAKPLLPVPPSLHNAVPARYSPPAPAFPSTTSGVNVFANDGSFLELFKKKMEQSPAGSKEEAVTPEDKKPEPDKRKPISFRDSERLQGLV